jgi:hypothetical protein
LCVFAKLGGSREAVRETRSQEWKDPGGGSMANGTVEVHLKNAKLADLDKQTAELREAYELYKTTRKVTRKPGDFTMSCEIRGKTGASSVKDVTRERLLGDAARFRILSGIKEHIAAHGDVASFDLAFDLSCRRIPDELVNPEDIVVGNPVAGF